MPVSRKTTIVFLLLSMVLLALLLAVAWLLAPETSGGGFAEGSATPLRISEYMAKNTAYASPDGRICDWVEIQNTSDAPFNLSGYRLTDDVTQARFAFPVGTVLPAGGYIVVWCSPEASGPLTAPFSLRSQGGETLQLMNSANTVLDEITTLRCPRNMSLVRLPDGSLTVSGTPTPGFENTESGYAAYTAAAGLGGGEVRLSEIMAAEALFTGPGGAAWDWIEVENAGSESADLSGMHLSDKEGEGRYTFPEGTVLAPGAFTVVWCSGDDTLGPDHAAFRLSKQGGESVILSNRNGNALDRVQLPYLSDDCSYARMDGAWTVTTLPTPGFENSESGRAAWLQSAGYGEITVSISEINPRNVTGLRDADGECCDWIELHNTGAQAVSLDGWYLSDDPENPARWRIPAVTLAPGEYKIIFASGKDRTGGELHTDFAVSAGESVTLMTPVGILADSVTCPLVADDASWARVSGVWAETEPTPGQ